jgi:hypothetical protein
MYAISMILIDQDTFSPLIQKRGIIIKMVQINYQHKRG